MDSDRQDDFLRVFSLHSRRIYGFISTLVLSATDADDIFQEVSVVLWRKFDEYDPDRSFYSWACKIAYLEVLHLRRGSKKLQVLSDDLLQMLADNMLERSSEIDARQAALEHCIAKLRDQDRELVRQRYHFRRMPKEIAALRDSSVHSVYRSLVRLHTALRGCVEKTLASEGRA